MSKPKKQPETASAQPENVPIEGNGPEWIRPFPASASQNREPLKEQPLPNEYIPKDILDLQETIRLMVYAPLEERQRLAWKFVGPFNPIPVIPTPAKPAHTPHVFYVGELMDLERELSETAAERDRLQGALNVHKQHLAAADRALLQAREQVKTLLAACKDALECSVDESAYPDGPCLAKHIRDDLHAAIASVESEGVK